MHELLTRHAAALEDLDHQDDDRTLLNSAPSRRACASPVMPIFHAAGRRYVRDGDHAAASVRGASSRSITQVARSLSKTKKTRERTDPPSSYLALSQAEPLQRLATTTRPYCRPKNWVQGGAKRAKDAGPAAGRIPPLEVAEVLAES
jgi:hypothetical protein